MMTISITKLKSNLYRFIDQVIETGLPIEIERNGHIVKLISTEKKSKLEKLKPHPGAIAEDSEQLIHNDWLEKWKRDDP